MLALPLYLPDPAGLKVPFKIGFLLVSSKDDDDNAEINSIGSGNRIKYVLRIHYVSLSHDCGCPMPTEPKPMLAQPRYDDLLNCGIEELARIQTTAQTK